MRAVVLVGGFGTRLRPLTYTTPKPMLPVVHRPIIEHLVDNLARGGVTEVTFALGFKPEVFVEAFPDGTCAGVALAYAVEPEPLDTAGAIRFAATHAGIDDTFVVVNGDVLTDLDVRVLLAEHRAKGAEATIHLTPVEDPSSFGVVALDADGRVIRFVEKPPRDTAPSNMINAGTYVFEPSMIDRVPVGGRLSVERAVFPSVAAEGRLFALCTEDYWIDTGRPELYRQANLDAVSGRRRSVHEPAFGPDVRVEGEVQLSVLGPGVRVSAGAEVRSSVLMAGVHVGEGAVVVDSVLGPDAQVGPQATLDDVVLGRGAVVEAGERLSNARRPVPA
jgi:mannose-1-phosphate guanylyltransferase